MSTTNLTPGWYPDPSGAPRKMYFDGESWIDAFATPTAADAATKKKSAGIGFGVIILGVVGLVMSQQSTSLLNGTGNIWLGVGIAAVAVAAAFFLSAADWAKWTAGVLLALALASALYMEHQMDAQRDKISHTFDTSYRS